jgi:hypothetical protein
MKGIYSISTCKRTEERGGNRQKMQNIQLGNDLVIYKKINDWVVGCYSINYFIYHPAAFKNLSYGLEGGSMKELSEPLKESHRKLESFSSNFSLELESVLQETC